MVILSGQSNMPHHRQNRRRERPGSRTRRSMNRKANAPFDYTDCLLDAHDTSVYLPSYKPSPSPLLRQNFDQTWQRWQARKAEEKALADMDRIQLQADQQRLFGEDICDEELYRMGILYDNDEDVTNDHQQNTILCDAPAQISVPSFVIRHGKPKRSQRRSTRRSLPLYLSFSGLSDDADIARLLSSTTTPSPRVQHPTTIPLMSFNTKIPQSLPTLPLSAFGSRSLHGSHFLDNTTFSVSTPTHSFENDQGSGDWTFIQTSRHDSKYSTPTSEPETWILIDDS